MALVAGIPEPREFVLDLTIEPAAPRPSEPVELVFRVFDPWKHNPVTKFAVVHEKLFHAFIVSRDLEFFVHDHPAWTNGAFHYVARLPRPGMYRVAGDFYPEAATPQMLVSTIFVAGAEAAPKPLTRDYATKTAENLSASLATSPPDPIAGAVTQVRVTLNPGEGLEKYLGAWGHMFVASEDLIDMIHTHPFIADGGPEMQFSVIFPRPQIYRIWVQLQRQGRVNTVHFDVPVKPSGN